MLRLLGGFSCREEGRYGSRNPLIVLSAGKKPSNEKWTTSSSIPLELGWYGIRSSTLGVGAKVVPLKRDGRGRPSSIRSWLRALDFLGLALQGPLQRLIQRGFLLLVFLLRDAALLALQF